MKNQRPHQHARLLLLVACTLAFSSGQSLAAEPAEATTSRDPFAAFEVVSSQDLSAMRGRAGDLTIVSSNQQFKSAVKDSTFNVDNINTGAVTVGEQALAGLHGVSLNVFTTGVGTAVSAGINITVNLH